MEQTPQEVIDMQAAKDKVLYDLQYPKDVVSECAPRCTRHKNSSQCKRPCVKKLTNPTEWSSRCQECHNIVYRNQGLEEVGNGKCRDCDGKAKPRKSGKGFCILCVKCQQVSSAPYVQAAQLSKHAALKRKWEDLQDEGLDEENSKILDKEYKDLEDKLETDMAILTYTQTSIDKLKEQLADKLQEITENGLVAATFYEVEQEYEESKKRIVAQYL